MNVFDYDDYRAYLKDFIALKDGKSRGYKSYLAEQIGCQRTFISQVLNGDAHFNIEHGDAIGRTFGLADEEIDFLLLLILYGRAGTVQLRGRLMNQMKSIREARSILKNRLKEKDTLSLKDKMEYYSSWLYGAIRVLLTIPQYQSREAVERYFKVPKTQINAVLDFLLSRNLIAEKAGQLLATEKYMHLGNDLKLVAKHHTNWRMRAIQSFDFEQKTDLHFSAVYSFSREDVEKLRDTWVQAIENMRKTVKNSKEECLYSICLDFFET
jgi:uncharacterized protein (TIGR02147 family)